MSPGTAADLGVCLVKERHWLTGETRECGESAVARVLIGCVHEHVTGSRACRRHLDRLKLGKTNCERCYSGPESHTCKVIGRVA